MPQNSSAFCLIERVSVESLISTPSHLNALSFSEMTTVAAVEFTRELRNTHDKSRFSGLSRLSPIRLGMLPFYRRQ